MDLLKLKQLEKLRIYDYIDYMNILFIHRDFPGQFKYIAPVLAQNPKNLVLFITAESEISSMSGINKLVYKIDKKSVPINPYLKEYTEAVQHGQAAAQIALSMKKRGIIPDIIYGHSRGSTMFMKDVFPDVPMLCYFEWFDNADGAAIGFDGNLPDLSYRETIRANNAFKLMDLCSCDGGISPTEWQKNQFPKEFHNKIRVIHDGINTDICKPDKNAKFLIPDKNIELSAEDEVVTYATRGMEPTRGFPQAMEAIAKLQRKRPNAHFVVGGLDKVCYGEKLKNGTYKELMLKKLNLDMKRVHFVGALDYNDYINLLQISSAHIYSTIPFILSWSLLEAMSVGCCVVASNTTPVLEVMKDNYNGLLFDFYNVDQLVEKVEYALDNKVGMQVIKENARKTVVENYDLKVLMTKQIEYMLTLMAKR